MYQHTSKGQISMILTPFLETNYRLFSELFMIYNIDTLLPCSKIKERDRERMRETLEERKRERERENKKSWEHERMNAQFAFLTLFISVSLSVYMSSIISYVSVLLKPLSGIILCFLLYVLK